jgi:predicted porin
VDTTDAATFPTGNGIPVAVNIAGIAPDGSVNGSNITLRGDTSEIDTMRWGVSGRATHRFSRNTSGHIQLTYNQQESEGGTLGNSSDFENFLALVGVRYVFDPIKLW